MRWKFLFLAVWPACCASAQTFEPPRFELGTDIGYGTYRNGSILSPEGSLEAGIRNRFAAGIILGVDFSRYVSGELNFLYHDGHPFLQGLGVKVDIQGNSWALTSGLLFHFKDRTHKFRPFVTGGIGAKEYIIAGPEPFPQPVPQVASLVDNDVWKLAFVVGGGVKYRIHRKVLLRGEFLDYLTTFPRTQILPAPHNTARGIFEQFTPLFGVSYVF
ncbi:MAG: outer membrane beta-barrel protein [Bryobacteraceae bacterium]|jgi:opacity protein-like surface antigen